MQSDDDPLIVTWLVLEQNILATMGESGANIRYMHKLRHVQADTLARQRSFVILRCYFACYPV